jgi:hypothetical protein
MSEESVEKEITKVADKYNLDDDAKAKLKRYVEFFLEYKRRSIKKK